MKSTANRILNFLLWISACVLTSTGFALAFKLGRGPKNRGNELLTMDKHEWSDLHTWCSYLFVALLILHLALHWQWLWKVATKGHRLPMLLGLASGILIVIVPLLLPIHKP